MSETPDAIRLRAEDGDDLVVIAAMLQDAITRPADMGFDRRARRFALVFSRYAWEREGSTQARPERVRTGMHFGGVLDVKMKGIDRRKHDPLALLTIRQAEGPDGTATLSLDFAGGGSIRLAVECIEAEMADLTTPWPAKSRPTHPES